MFATDDADTAPVVKQSYVRAREENLIPYVTVGTVEVLTPGR